MMSGFNVMVFYVVTIFETSGSSLDPNLSSVVVGCVLLISCFVALAIVSQLGRKPILVTSILGMSVSHVVLGTCYHLRGTLDPTETTPDYLGWLPLLAVVSFLFLGNIGYGTLIWVVTAELLPPKVSCVGCVGSSSSHYCNVRIAGPGHGELFHHLLCFHHRVHCGEIVRRSDRVSPPGRSGHILALRWDLFRRGDFHPDLRP